MRAFFGVGLLAAVLALTAGCGGEPKLDGTYLLVGREEFGEVEPQKEIDEAPEDQRTFRIEAGTLYVKKGAKGDKESRVNFTTDPSKSPRQINLTEQRERGDPETMYGIYKLEQGVLTICVAMKEENRPKEFKTSKEAKSVMLTLKKK